MKGRWSTTAGALILASLAGAALAAPWLAPAGTPAYPLHLDLQAANLPLLSPGHPLGTDYLGRDMLGAAVWGARASLAIGLAAAGLAVSFGSLWGSVSALCGGFIDSLMMRIVDGLLAIPNIVLLLALQSLVSGAALAHTLPEPLLELLNVSSYSLGLLPLITLAAVVSATTWLEAARLSRAQVLAIKNQEYITAARALGVSQARMLTRHLLPNVSVVMVVEATLLVSDAVLMEAGLGFLGLGLGPSIPSWGGMLSSAQGSLMQGNWWAALIPGLSITATVMGVNLLSEGLLTGTRRHRGAARSGS